MTDFHQKILVRGNFTEWHIKNSACVRCLKSVLKLQKFISPQPFVRLGHHFDSRKKFFVPVIFREESEFKFRTVLDVLGCGRKLFGYTRFGPNCRSKAL